MDERLLLLLGALLLDALLGDPDWLWRRLPHPVVLLGRLVGGLEQRLNPARLRAASAPAGSARLAGVAALLLLLGLAVAAGLAIEALGQWPLELLVAAVLLAQRSLYDHVAAVARALIGDGLSGGRQAVARIVGRDPERLDEAGVSRAAIESLAENFSDGVIAPALWFALAGLPGLLAYKALNTADSMIGHRSDRYRHFGWAAARLDDLANLPASRLTAVLIALARPRRAAAALSAVARDAGHHRSPNAGWPEAALGGALGLALAGPRHYAEGAVEDAWMNAGGRTDADARDIAAALALYRNACGVGWLFVALLATAAGVI